MDTMMSLVVDEAIINDECFFNSSKNKSPNPRPTNTIYDEKNAQDQQRNSDITKSDIESIQTNSEEQHPKEKVKWHKQPALLILLPLIGTGFAAGHHAFYSHLHHTVPGSGNHQQTIHGIGNVFAFLVAFSFIVAFRIAYTQYWWMLVSRKAFSIRALDSLYALPFEPFGIWSKEVWRRANMAIMLTLSFWIMIFACLIPPGTLTILLRTAGHTTEAMIPTLDWTSNRWYSSAVPGRPSSLVRILVAKTSIRSQIPPFIAPGRISSYSIDIDGPFLKCEPPNSTQISIFEHVKRELSANTTDGNSIVTKYTETPALDRFKKGPLLITGGEDQLSSAERLRSYGLVAMLFDPVLGELAKRNDTVISQGKNLSAWKPDLPVDFEQLVGYKVRCETSDLAASNTSVSQNCRLMPLQLWILTSNHSFICTLGSGTRRTTFKFREDRQIITYGALQDFKPIFVRLPVSNTSQKPSLDSIPALVPMLPENKASLSIYTSLLQIISGMITIPLPLNGSSSILVADNGLLKTALGACDEIAKNPWVQNQTSTSLFRKSGNMCRNHTIARAIEDLSANLTIAMMSSPELTSIDGSSTNVTVSTLRNVYVYTPFYLILSYSIALLIFSPCLVLGLYSVHWNVGWYSKSFSSLVASTRNRELNEILGKGVGGGEKQGDSERLELRFGILLAQDEGGKQRRAFGSVGGVRKLSRGD